ncbi:MAG: hypothetical protein P1U87_08880 [Verrucomicrobiales bacterium]|nr:hypothetical protein [Verrucomicrobiales bacterium]
MESLLKPGTKVSKIPDAKKADGTWAQVIPKFEKVRLDFDYDPATIEGEVSFFLSDKALARGGGIVLRNFSMGRFEGGE